VKESRKLSCARVNKTQWKRTTDSCKEYRIPKKNMHDCCGPHSHTKIASIFVFWPKGKYNTHSKDRIRKTLRIRQVVHYPMLTL